MEKINKLTVNGQSYILSDPETAKGLSQEISNRQAADETVLQTAQNYTDTVTAELPTKEFVQTGLNTVQSNAMKAVTVLGNRVSALEAGYRHIATYEHTEDVQIQQVDITADSDGNAFACGDFMLFLTLPTSQEIYDNHTTQFYVGKTASWSDWIVLFRQAFSRTVQRKWRIHIRHWHDGWWIADGVMSEDANDYAVRDSSAYMEGSIRSQKQLETTLERLTFYTTAKLPVGTKIEIYGK